MGKKDHIVIGLLIGLLVPAIFVGIVYMIFIFGEREITRHIVGQVVLFGLAANILPVRLLSKRKKEMTSRGVMVITIFLVLGWVIQFMLD